MVEFLRDFFSKKEYFTRVVRGVGLALAAVALSDQGQVALEAFGGPAAVIGPAVAAFLSGAIAAGEKNPQE